MSGVTGWLKDLVSVNGSSKSGPAQPRTGAERPARPIRPQRRGNEVSSIETVTPDSFADAGKIAEVLREGIPVVVNVQNLTDTDTRRLVDFMAGLKAGLHATTKRVAEQVYLMAPEGVEVYGDPDEVLEAESGKLIFKP